MKITLIIIGTVIGLIFGFYSISKTPERKKVYRKYPHLGLLIMLTYGGLYGLTGWLIFILFIK
jgi:ABC-type amino acid transport system permease subunit